MSIVAIAVVAGAVLESVAQGLVLAIVSKVTVHHPMLSFVRKLLADGRRCLRKRDPSTGSLADWWRRLR